MEQRLSLYLPIVLLNRPGRLDPGRNNLRLFTIKCLQNCPKVAMLYNPRKTGVQIGNHIAAIRPQGEIDFSGTLIRLHIGLEDVDDLIADLDAGFARIV